jgi:hypothetical protein
MTTQRSHSPRRVLSCTAIAIALIATLAACAIPFEISTEAASIDLPPNVGAYVEQTVDTPPEALDPKVAIDGVTLRYTLANDTAFPASVELFVTLSDTADLSSDGAVSLLSIDAPAHSERTGEISAPILADALKRARFVIGIKNVSASSILGSVSLTYRATVTGSYAAF